MLNIALPLTTDVTKTLRAGDSVALSGAIYTARDAAHARLCELLDSGEPLPFELAGATIYYAGPAPASPGRVIGSVGPTTSYRMDAFAPRLLRLGQLGMVGKGERSAEVADAIREVGAVYLAAAGGAGALLSECVKSAEIVAFPDLGAEAVRRLIVENFPCVVAIDCNGGNIYVDGKRDYLRSLAALSD
ncbi:MAG: Fe-S-containing hydro-lyase [Oscillospiraceae bacterium]|jgi:fumarate hydratase subunit beta|nr:Fe-S-containing hydro-lyase [Oscillospiraceae bacterium]